MSHPRQTRVLVSWHDAYSPAATDVFTAETAADLLKPFPIVTQGWLLADTPAGVIVAAEWCGDGDFRGLTVVPRAMVSGIEKQSGPRRKISPKIGVKAESDQKAEAEYRLPCSN